MRTITFAFLLGFLISGAGTALANKGVSFPPKMVADESSLLVYRPTLNFAGAGITCADDTTQSTCTVPIQPAYATVQDEGSGLTQRATLNFAGAGVSCVDDTTRTTCTIAGGGGASPLTTKGDVYTFTTVDARLAVGADGTCLKANSATATGLEYGTCSAGGGLTFGEVQRLVFMAQ